MKETEMTLWQYLDVISDKNLFTRVNSRVIKVIFLVESFFFGALVGLKEFSLSDFTAFLLVFGMAFLLDHSKIIITDK